MALVSMARSSFPPYVIRKGSTQLIGKGPAGWKNNARWRRSELSINAFHVLQTRCEKSKSFIGKHIRIASRSSAVFKTASAVGVERGIAALPFAMHSFLRRSSLSLRLCGGGVRLKLALP